MAKKNTAGLAVAVGLLGATTLFNLRKKKEQKAQQRSAKEHADKMAEEAKRQSEPVEIEQPYTQTNMERKCPSCGYIDNTGASSCPLCFANMSGGSANTGFEEY
jgi:hypothetical protein